MFQTKVVEEKETYIFMSKTLSLQILWFSKQLKKINLYAVEAITELIHKNCYARHTFPNLIILHEI